MVVAAIPAAGRWLRCVPTARGWRPFPIRWRSTGRRSIVPAGTALRRGRRRAVAWRVETARQIGGTAHLRVAPFKLTGGGKGWGLRVIALGRRRRRSRGCALGRLGFVAVLVPSGCGGLRGGGSGGLGGPGFAAVFGRCCRLGRLGRAALGRLGRWGCLGGGRLMSLGLRPWRRRLVRLRGSGRLRGGGSRCRTCRLAVLRFVPLARIRGGQSGAYQGGHTDAGGDHRDAGFMFHIHLFVLLSPDPT